MILRCPCGGIGRFNGWLAGAVGMASSWFRMLVSDVPRDQAEHREIEAHADAEQHATFARKRPLYLHEYWQEGHLDSELSTKNHRLAVIKTELGAKFCEFYGASPLGVKGAICTELPEAETDVINIRGNAPHLVLAEVKKDTRARREVTPAFRGQVENAAAANLKNWQQEAAGS